MGKILNMGLTKDSICKIIKDETSNLPTKDDLANLLTKDDLETLKIDLQNHFEKTFGAQLEQRDIKIVELENKIKHLEWQNEISNLYRDHHARLIDDLNQYGRKVNLVIRGMPLRDGQTNWEIREAVLDEIERLNLEIDELELDRAHRYGPTFTDRHGKKQQSIICRFTTWSARDELYQARKRSKFYISADLTERRQKILDSAREKISIEGSRATNLIKYVCADKNCYLLACTSDDRYMKFSSIDEFESLLNYVEDTGDIYAEAFKVLTIDDVELEQPQITVVNLKHIRDVTVWASVTNKHIYIGRQNNKLGLEASKWQNPFSTSEYDIETCLSKYEEHIRNSPDLYNNLGELRGMELGCYCTDSSSRNSKCHAFVLEKLLYHF